jgi:transketolase
LGTKGSRKESQTPSRAPAVKKDKVQSGLAKAAIRAAQAGLPVYSISADVQGSTGISGFQKSFPDRYLDVGVSRGEHGQHGCWLRQGLGSFPSSNTFGQFGVSPRETYPAHDGRGLSQAPVIALFSPVGFQDAADGASHQATTYTRMRSPPSRTTTVIAPSCADEAEALMFDAIQRYASERNAGRDGETYIFFVGRENYPVYWVENAKYEWGRARGCFGRAKT